MSVVRDLRYRVHYCEFIRQLRAARQVDCDIIHVQIFRTYMEF